MRRIHYAWIVAGVALLTLITSAGFRSTTGVLIVPLQNEFGWSRATISFAIAINLVVYGLGGPFAAAFVEKYGMRRVITVAVLGISLGAGLSTLMTASNASGQLIFLPLLAWIVTRWGWRYAAGTAAAVALTVVLPLVLLFIRDRPSDLGLAPYGSTEIEPAP